MNDDAFSNLALLYDAVREVVGEEAILTLQQQFGGLSIHVPGRRATESTALARAFGMEVASALVSRLRVIGADGRVAAGFEVYVPMGQFSIRSRARAMAIAALKEDATRRQVAAQSGLCVRTISRIRRDLGLPRTGSGAASVRATKSARVSRSGAERIMAARSSAIERRAARDAALVSAHAEGLRPADIARRFGWSVGHVHCLYWRLRKESGLALAFDTKGVQASRWEEHVKRRQSDVEAGFRTGLSVAQIAQRLGISVRSVRTYVAKLRSATGEPFAFDQSRDHPHTRLGRERRRLIAEAYLPGMTLADLASRTGLSERLVQQHLVTIRRETGYPFKINRRTSLPKSDGADQRDRSRSDIGVAA